MKNFKELMRSELMPGYQWENAIIQYERFINDPPTNNKIPKKIHQIWFGEFQERLEVLINSVKEKHPDWEYKLWTLDDMKDYPLKNKELFEEIDNYGAKSDVARYEILNNEGGFYLDCDFYMINSFDNLLGNTFVTGSTENYETVVNNGLIGCVAGCGIIKSLVDNLPEHYNGDPMSSTGPYYFSRIFFDHMRDNMEERNLVLPGPYFYPLSRHARHEARNKIPGQDDYITSFNTEETICVHLWYCSWIP